MGISETTLLNAIDRVKKGASIDEVVFSFEGDQKELRSALQTAKALITLPKNRVPEPAMQRKFMMSPVKHLWLSWLPVSRMAAASLSVVLVLSALAGTSYAALTSVPGQTLFSVKKSAEHLRIKLTFNPETRVNLQVEIAKQRLSEAQAIFQNPNSHPNQEKAAIKELLAETKNSIEAVDTATKVNPSPAQSHPLVASLEDITQKQKALLEQIKPKEEVTDTAKIALETSQQNADQVVQIKRYIQAAADEQSLADLDTNPNKVTISGSVNSLVKNTVTVEKTSFDISEKTVIKNPDGTATSSSAISAGIKVSVKGTKGKDKISADQIVILENTLTAVPEVRGTSTAATTSTTTKPSLSPYASSTPTGSIENEIPKQLEESPAKDPNTATANFIPEDPTPHYEY